MTTRLENRETMRALRRKSAQTAQGNAPGAAKRRVLSVMGAMFFSNGLTVLLQLAMVPVLIWAWGATLYGEWIILYTIPGYLALTDFGIIASANNRIEAQCARRYFGAANRTYFNSLIVLTGMIAIVIGAGTLLWLTIGENFSSLFVSLTRNEVLKVSTLLFLDAMLLLAFNHHTGLYRTLGRFNWTVNWQAIGRTLPIFGLCAAAGFGATLILAASIMLSMRLAIFGIMIIDLRRRITWLRFSWLRGSHSEVRRLIRTAVGFMTLPLSNMIYLHTTTILVAALTTPSMVAAFSTMRTFLRMIIQIVAISGRSHWSEISTATARGEHDRVQAMQGKVMRQTLALSTVAVVGYLSLGKQFYVLWTGGKLEFEWVLFLALLANCTMIACYYSLEVFLLATSRVKGYAQVFLLATLAQIAGGYLLVDFFGIASFPITGTVAATFIFGYLIWKIKR